MSNRVRARMSALVAGLSLLSLSAMFGVLGPAPTAFALDPNGPVVLEFSKDPCTDSLEEDADIKTALEVISASVTLFNGGDGSLTAWTTALTGVDVLVIPEGQFFGCAGAVSADAQGYIKTWVESGKTVLGTGAYEHLDFVNYMSGISFSDVWSDNGLDDENLNPWSRQVASSTLPATVPNANYAGGLENYSTYSLAQKAFITPIYYSAGEDNLAIAQFNFGSGFFLYYAYDWYPDGDEATNGVRAAWDQALQFGASGQISQDAGGGGGSGADPGPTTPLQGPGEPAIALDVRWAAGANVNGSVFEIGATNLPDGATWTVDLSEPHRVLGEGTVASPGQLWRNIPLGDVGAPGTYTLSFRVVLPSGETLELRRVFSITAEGTFADVGENQVGGAAAKPAAEERLAYTGLRSAVLPWWALTALLFGFLLVAYSIRARRLVAEIEARLVVPKVKTPWEVLSTPIRVPGIDYQPQAVSREEQPASLGQALRDLDLALSRTVVNHLSSLSLGRHHSF